MISCILAFYLLGSASPGLIAGSPTQDAPDALYRQRTDPAQVERAVAIWAARAADGTDFEAAWKLARACYWIGTQGAADGRRRALERGVAAGEQAARIDASRPEGHFWQAANMGALAESFGMTQGLRYRGRIKASLERVLKMDPGWQQGSADRALGWWYHRVPGLFGGSEERAEMHLRRALGYNPQSTATLYFLAEVLLERDKDAEARTMLQRALDAPLDPDWTPEDLDFKAKAKARLAALSDR
jgi:tetratricopeptide (TPR) repeat protein